MRAISTVLRLDPGWLFLLAGLAACVAGIVVPAERDRQALHRQLDRLHSDEAASGARLNAHTAFLRQVEGHDPALIRRLAAAQLNLMPQGETPVLIGSSRLAKVTDWIDATVQTQPQQPPEPAETPLSRLANGPYRLWLLGGGVMSVFVGLLFDSRAASGNRVRLFISSRLPAATFGREEADDHTWTPAQREADMDAYRSGEPDEDVWEDDP